MGSCSGSLQLTNSQTHHSKRFTLYVEGHRQKVSVSGVLPSSLSMTFGALQSSILGPLLFIVFIVDVPLHPLSTALVVSVPYGKLHIFFPGTILKAFCLSHLASSENSKDSSLYGYFILHISNNPDTVTHKKPINILGKNPLLLTYFFLQIYFVPYLESQPATVPPKENRKVSNKTREKNIEIYLIKKMACTHVIKGINKQSNNSLTGQLQDDIILLQLPESFS